MHKYSCENDRRDLISVVLLTISAIIAFSISALIEWCVGGSNILLDFAIFVATLSPLTIWLFLTDHTPNQTLLMLSGIKDCSGKYHGGLKTDYDNFSKEIPITITIKQKFRQMEIELSTDSSTSYSNTASIQQDGDRTEIMYTYNNRGSVENKLKSHAGTCLITICNGKLDGVYYTHPERGNSGVFHATVADNAHIE